MKSVYETVCACDSEVARNDAEYANPFAIAIWQMCFFVGLLLPLVGQSEGDGCSRCGQALCLS